MNIALLVALGTVGQFGYAGPYSTGGYGVSPYRYGGYGGFGYGFYGIPRPVYDPIAYARFYSGSGFYTLPPTPVFPPKVITIRPRLMERPGVTGRVLALDERANTITLRLPAETVLVRYGPGTRFQSIDDEFPEIKAGAIVNVDRETITVLRKGDG